MASLGKDKSGHVTSAPQTTLSARSIICKKRHNLKQMFHLRINIAGIGVRVGVLCVGNMAWWKQRRERRQQKKIDAHEFWFWLPCSRFRVLSAVFAMYLHQLHQTLFLIQGSIAFVFVWWNQRKNACLRACVKKWTDVLKRLFLLFLMIRMKTKKKKRVSAPPHIKEKNVHSPSVKKKRKLLTEGRSTLEVGERYGYRLRPIKKNSTNMKR